MRTPTTKEYVHERLGEQFAEALSMYDTNRRIHILIDRFLGDVQLKGLKTLEVGAGLGFFTEALIKHGAEVIAIDIGEGLVQRLRSSLGCEALVVDALALSDCFGGSSFDLVVSSECIEHTPDPRSALMQMASVLKPGGYLSISTPNAAWYGVVKAATALRLRPFDGHENFSTFGGIRSTLQTAGLEVLQEYGLHLFPFQLPFHGLSQWCDEKLQFLRSCMINICVLARKPDPRGYRPL